MKKLMLAVAIVCAAVMAQAATTKWNFTTGSNNIYLPGQDTKTASGTAYLFCLSTADTATTATIYSQSDIVSEFNKGTDISTLNYVTSAAMSEGAVAKQFTSELFASGKSTKFFFAIVEDGNIFISGTSQKTSNATTAQPLSFNGTAASQAALNDISKGYSASGWYGNVPEPTSGLLLLIGMAGLALKRKCA